jgi:hypothetical protein
MYKSSIEKQPAVLQDDLILHPYYILRVGGEPISLIANLETGETEACLQHADAIREEAWACSESACEILEKLIPHLDEAQGIRTALKIKRAFYNLRAVASDVVCSLRTRLPESAFAKLTALNGLLERMLAAEAEARKAYDREIAAASPVIRELVQRKNFAAALSYTNPELYLKVREQLLGPERHKLKAKTLRNLEDSLLQYFARSSTKISPLAAFTPIDVGRWRQDRDRQVAPIQYQGEVATRVEIKAGLMRYLMAPLLADFATASALFPIRLNTSIRVANGRASLYVVAPGQEISGRTWGSGLTAMSMEINGALQCIHYAFSQSSSPVMRVGDLVQAVRALAPKLLPEQLMGFLAKLYALNYLEADTGYFEQQDMIEWAHGIAAKVDQLRGSNIVGQIDDLKQILAVQPTLSGSAKARAVLDVRQRMQALARETGANANSPLFQPSFYENCYLNESNTTLPTGFLEPYGQDFAILQRMACLLDNNQLFRARLNDYFLSRFGADGVCTDIASFLEDFDDIYAPGVLDAAIDFERAAPNSEITEALLAARAKLDKYLESVLLGGENATLDRGCMHAIIDMIPRAITRRGLSYSYVVQPVKEPGCSQLVLNQIFGGRSSIVSRFFEVLDDDDLKEVQNYLDAGKRGTAFVELPGVFGFNANRHPRMADIELEVPPFPPARLDTERLSIHDLHLVYDREIESVTLCKPDGESIDLWYMGLLIPSLLPRLQRLLALCFTEGPSFTIINSLVVRKLVNGRDFACFPRITLGHVVLFRRTWIIPQSMAPQADMTPVDFFFSVRNWQRDIGLPSRFFVRALPLPETVDENGNSPSINWETVNFKDMKPFYVDLKSPRFVRLFQNMVKRNNHVLCVAELLPDFDSYFTEVDGNPHISELHFELTTPAATPLAESKWRVARVAYFEEERCDLVMGPIRSAVEALRAEFGVQKIMVMPHWKFGPHIDLVVHAPEEVFETRLFPRIKAIIEPWLEVNPSTRQLDPQAYEALSQKIGMFELEQGPYLPLMENNRVKMALYQPSKNLLLDAFAEAKADMLSGCLDLIFQLYAVKQERPNDFFLTLVAMLAVVAETFPNRGMRAGYMSLRSHADYFFAAHDASGKMHAQFDHIDQKQTETIDRIIDAVHSDALEALPLPSHLQAIVLDWQHQARRMDDVNEHIVSENYDFLVNQEAHLDTARAMQDQVPKAFRKKFENKKISEIGEVFLNTERGRLARSAPEFLIYRTNVNFFYSLLPILEVTPIQKFLLCHLVANAVSRVYDEDWRKAVKGNAEEK